MSEEESLRVSAITCPKCKHVNDSQDHYECPQCGIVYEKYKKIQQGEFDETLSQIGKSYFVNTKTVFENFGKRFPELVPLCDKYLKVISKAVQEYENRNFDNAEKLFRILKEKNPEISKAADLYISKIEERRKYSDDFDKAVKAFRADHYDEAGLLFHNLKNEHPGDTGFDPYLKKIKEIRGEEPQKTIIKEIEKEQIIPIKTKTSPLTMGFAAVFGTILFVLLVSPFIHSSKPPGKVSDSTSSTSYSPPAPSQTKKTPSSYSPGYADSTVFAINSVYGNVCHAEVSGIFTKTLKLDWTSKTTKLHAMKVIAEVSDVKNKLYEDGVRYFQFPNDAGTYNVIDWKTGRKESISDRAP